MKEVHSQQDYATFVTVEYKWFIIEQLVVDSEKGISKKNHPKIRGFTNKKSTVAFFMLFKLAFCKLDSFDKISHNYIKKKL